MDQVSGIENADFAEAGLLKSFAQLRLGHRQWAACRLALLHRCATLRRTFRGARRSAALAAHAGLALLLC